MTGEPRTRQSWSDYFQHARHLQMLEELDFVGIGSRVDVGFSLEIRWAVIMVRAWG